MAELATAQRVAARVAEVIEDSGVSLVWVCEKTGIPRTTLDRRLKGLTAFDLNEIDRIAAALRVSSDDLLLPSKRDAA